MSATHAIEFDDWYCDNYTRVLASVQLVCGDLETAQDATQNACIKAIERWPRVQAMQSPTAWVVRVAVNSAKSSFARGVRRRFMEQSSSRNDSTTDRYEDHELWQLVGALPERQRLAIVLRYVEDLDQKRIASVLDVAPGTAAAALHQARSSLRNSPLLKENDGSNA